MAMTQRTLYKTIEKIGTQHFATEEAMLIAILGEIVKNDRINIVGGRIWKLHPEDKLYELMFEEGAIEPVGIGFRINIKDYEVFDEVARYRTILAEETNRTLRRKGIKKYSATGIGHTIKVGRVAYYEYLMAFNTHENEHDPGFMLNIAGQAVTNLLEKRRSDAEKRSLLTEMEHAAELQRQILPEHEYNFGRYELYGISIPDRTVGGDFFNYYQIPDDAGRLAVAIGDAASKGLPAAVQALFVSGALMMSVEHESKISSMLRRINTINRKIFPSDKLLSLFFCELFNVKEGLMLYANAGHPGPIHYHAATKQCTQLAVTGPIIGLIPDASFTVGSLNMMKGDVVLLYTDGITEANNGIDEFGEPGIIESLTAHADRPTKEICQHLLQVVQTFSATGSIYSDDKTVVVIKRIK
jgi:sigma-B regulation protein RsbU (phosphoserine phosphatase)